jgi:hypothetical protein
VYARPVVRGRAGGWVDVSVRGTPVAPCAACAPDAKEAFIPRRCNAASACTRVRDTSLSVKLDFTLGSPCGCDVCGGVGSRDGADGPAPPFGPKALIL